MSQSKRRELVIQRIDATSCPQVNRPKPWAGTPVAAYPPHGPIDIIPGSNAGASTTT